MSINRTGTATLAAPTGMIMQHTATAVPTGWLLCDGTAYNGTTTPAYAPLYAVIINVYGGTDITNFKVPDLRGRTAVGSGTGTASGATAKTLGSTPTSGAGGEETHLLTGGETGTTAHLHPITDVSHNHPQDAHAHVYSDRIENGWWFGQNGSDSTTMQADYRSDVNRGSGGQGGGGNQPSYSNVTTTTNSTAANAASAHNIMQPFTVVNYIIKI